MSLTKAWIEEEKIKEIERRMENWEFDCLEVFVNIEAQPNGVKCTWFYRIWADLGDEIFQISTKHGNDEFCNCDECKEFAVEIRELRSLVAAMEEICPDSQTVVWHWVSSNRLIETDDVVKIEGGAGIKCTALKGLLYRINRYFYKCFCLLKYYRYENKEEIRVWF